MPPALWSERSGHDRGGGPILAAASFAISLTIVVALVYLAVVRVIDVNEREPLWGAAVVLGLGAGAGMLVRLLVDPAALELTSFRAAAAESTAIFAALLLSVAVFHGLSRLRGWSEVNGVIDGVVYGAAAGLGFATGGTFVRELSFAGLAPYLGGSDTLDVLWTTLLGGLAYGIFGAVIGTGFGAAVLARRDVWRVALPLVSLAAGVAAEYLWLLLRAADTGTGGLVRAWLALLLPIACLVAAAVYSLTHERRAIAAELRGETATGAVTNDELVVVANPAARRRAYWHHLARLDLDGWAARRVLHNRQVQLALIKRRAQAEPDPAARGSLEGEAERLRAAASAARAELEHSSPPRIREVRIE